MNVVMIAPGHDQYDQRVMRSVKVLQELNYSVDLFLENHRLGDKAIKNYIFGYDSIGILPILFGLTSAFDAQMKSKVSKADVIYIHDSGLYGLRMLRSLLRFNSNARVIFDYHDWIPWEVVHHGKKISKNRIYMLILRFISGFFLKKTILFRPQIDALVGITECQLKNFESALGYKKEIPKCAISNTRPKIMDLRCSSGEVDSRLNLIWIGNVGAGRGFEQVVKMHQGIAKSNIVRDGDVVMTVFGKVWGNETFTSLASLDFRGAFKNDMDIHEKVPQSRLIGIFQGWDDPYNTQINEIASPNKVYSYLNLGIPFLINHKLTDFIKTANLPDYFVYENQEDFLTKVSYIYDNYNEARDILLRLRDSIRWDKDESQRLKKFLLDLSDVS